MQRPVRFHPGPLTILVAIVLCLMASFAFGQIRRIAPGGPSGSRPATTALPAPSGLTSGAAPGLVTGMPAASGLTSGTTGGTTTGAATPDTTTTVTGGSTRGVVVVPVDSGLGTTTTTITGTTGTSGTTTGTSTGITGGAAVVSGFAGVTNGVPSVAPGRLQTMGGGPLTALQVAQLFAQADADGDGLLTRAEALRLPMVTMSFDDMDTNRDGVVSRSEYEASLR